MLDLVFMIAMLLIQMGMFCLVVRANVIIQRDVVETHKLQRELYEAKRQYQIAVETYEIAIVNMNERREALEKEVKARDSPKDINIRFLPASNTVFCAKQNE